MYANARNYQAPCIPVTRSALTSCCWPSACIECSSCPGKPRRRYTSRLPVHRRNILLIVTLIRQPKFSNSLQRERERESCRYLEVSCTAFGASNSSTCRARCNSHLAFRLHFCHLPLPLCYVSRRKKLAVPTPAMQWVEFFLWNGMQGFFYIMWKSYLHKPQIISSTETPCV